MRAIAASLAVLVVIAAGCASGPQRRVVTNLDFRDHDAAVSGGAKESSARAVGETVSKVQPVITELTEQDKTTIAEEAFYFASFAYWQAERHIFVLDKAMLDIPGIGRLRKSTGRIISREEIEKIKKAEPWRNMVWVFVGAIKLSDGTANVSVSIPDYDTEILYDCYLVRDANGKWRVKTTK
jgi:hypothetical protein